MTAKEWFDALQWIHIVLMLAIFLLFAGYMYILIRIIPRLKFVGGLIGKWKIQVWGSLFGSLFIFYLFYNLPKIQPNQWVEISLLAGLVAATFALAMYAALQAYNTEQMVKEMSEQRLSEARPYLLLRLTDGYLRWRAGADNKLAQEFSVTVFNGGKGPARNLEASLWSYEDIFPADTKGYLATNQEWTATIPKSSAGSIASGEKISHPELKDVIQRNSLCIIVKYEDIHHREWVSYLYLEDVNDTGWVRDDEQNIVEVTQHD